MLFAEWQEHYDARQGAKAEADSARLAELCTEREALFEKRIAAPEAGRAALTERIAANAKEIAELTAPKRTGMLSLWS